MLIMAGIQRLLSKSVFTIVLPNHGPEHSLNRATRQVDAAFKPTITQKD